MHNGPHGVSHDLARDWHLAAVTAPLRPLRLHAGGFETRLGLKLEQYNPTGSIKYRTAVGLLAALDADRPLEPASTVVESTSGNLGLALASLLARRGCHFIAVVDPKLTPSARAAMLAAGTQLLDVVERDANGGFLLSRLDQVRRMCQADPELRWTNQYSSMANPDIHRATLAVELLQQTGHSLDAVFVAVSTGGTLAGVSEGIRRVLPGTQVYAVDVRGSLVTSDSACAHLLTGIGATRKSSFIRPGHYDEAVRVADTEAFAYCRMLAADTGLALGGSSGAILAAACRVVARGTCLHSPVAVMPDGGARYLDTLYCDGWLAERGALGAVAAAIRRARRRGVRFEFGSHALDGEVRA